MLGLIAFSLQAAFTAAHGLNPTHDPNIIVPSSSIENWYDVGRKVHTHYLIYAGSGARQAPATMDLHGPLTVAGQYGYAPADIRAAYNVPRVGGSRAIAIVDAYDYPSALQDFNTFSATYGLPLESSTSVTSSTNKVFQVVYGSGTKPVVDSGWNGEEALDIEWAHSMAPNAKIYLVEAASPYWSDFSVAINTARALTGTSEVSMSFGGQEFATEGTLDTLFSYPGVVFFASAGDVGGEQQYPSESVNVVGVGGTSLYMTGSTVTAEQAWSGSGGGPSKYESRPAFQASVASIVGTFRGTPDIAAVADPYTGAAVYEGGSWMQVGGTSLACPVIAGIINNQSTFLGSSQSQNLFFYNNLGKSAFRDITVGSAGSFSALVGWDFITGVGTPIGLTRTIVPESYAPDGASYVAGTYLAGNLASILTPNDGKTFQMKATTVSGLGAVADVRAHFTVNDHPRSNIVNASVTVVGLATTGGPSTGYVTNEIFLLNPSTGKYELLATPLVKSTNTTMSASMSQSQALKYLDSNGNIVVLTRSLLPQRFFSGNNPAYTYKVDQVQVTFNYSQ